MNERGPDAGRISRSAAPSAGVSDAGRKLLSDLGFRPSKARGQNFLVHPHTADKIAACMPRECSTAVEIGAGLGDLTQKLIACAGIVAAVEIDRRLLQVLWRRFSPQPESRLRLIEADALKIDWEAWLAETPVPRVLFGNLPYSISAPLIEKCFQNSRLFTEAVLCLQAEVACRLTSGGGRTMGPITLLAHRFCSRREILFRLSPGEFRPRPKVDSMVVRLVFRPQVRWSKLDRQIPRMLFAHRRKLLSSVLPPESLRGRAECASKRIDQLTVETAGEIADAIYEDRRGTDDPITAKQA